MSLSQETYPIVLKPPSPEPELTEDEYDSVILNESVQFDESKQVFDFTKKVKHYVNDTKQIGLNTFKSASKTQIQMKQAFDK